MESDGSFSFFALRRLAPSPLLRREGVFCPGWLTTRALNFRRSPPERPAMTRIWMDVWWRWPDSSPKRSCRFRLPIDTNAGCLIPGDDSPLALMFSCTDKSYFDVYPPATEWVALPAILMPIETSEAERSRCYGPVNYRFECCVAERAGTYPKARWFARSVDDETDFPALLVREDWDDEESRDLCQRYLNRQSPRLLMLHGLSHDARKRMESAAKAHALDVERYFPLYPEVIDQHAMDGIRVEARLRRAAGEQAYTVANTLR